MIQTLSWETNAHACPFVGIIQYNEPRRVIRCDDGFFRRIMLDDESFGGIMVRFATRSRNESQKQTLSWDDARRQTISWDVSRGITLLWDYGQLDALLRNESEKNPIVGQCATTGPFLGYG